MLKVLIVEDEDIIRKGLVYTIDWLAMDCAIVGEAANGREGLRFIREKQPDLVITDIIMPEMGGIEMLEAAEAENAHSFKSMILTSYSEFDYARQAVKLQVSDYLLKPVDEDELIKAVERVKGQISLEGSGHGRAVELADNGIAEEFGEWGPYIDAAKTQNPYVMQVLSKIRDHYHEKISIECIAEELQVSTSYLSRKFREETTQTFLDSLTRYRIRQAIALLKKGTYRVYEISALVGFNDYKHFCMVFKKYTHASPREFVKRRAGSKRVKNERGE